MKRSFRLPDWSVLLIGTSLVLTLILEVLSRQSLTGSLAFVFTSPGLFIFNALLVLDTLFICLLFRRRLFAYILITMLWLTIGITNCVMVSFRTLPFTVIDLTLLKDAISLFDVYFNLFQRILIISGGIAAVLTVAALFIKAPKTDRCPVHKFIGGAAVLMLLTIGCLNLGLNTNALSTSLNDLMGAYRQYGFAYCFATSFADVGVDKPENYSEETLVDVEEQIETAELPESAYPLQPNIVFVQLESFFDPKHITGLDVKEDPVPVFTKLKKAYPSGFLTMPSIGGGTANSEFEVLTGMTLSHFGAGEYPYNTALQETAVESICYNLSTLNYTSHAVHNHAGSFYTRHKVYPNMGFDTFTSLEYMHDYEINPLGWANDDVLVSEILNAIRSTEGSDFVFAVTVQSHGHYPTEPVLEDTLIEQFEPDTASYWGLDYYMQEIAKVDAFIGDLLTAMEESDEPTIVVLYGDHLPALGLEAENLENGSLYQTEYVIWNNYSGFLQHIADRDLHAYQLSAYVTDLLKIRTGQVSLLHQSYLQGSLPEDVDYLNALQLLEYDLLSGENVLHDGQEPYRPTKMRMGVSPIGITDAALSEDALIIRGTGFTQHSEVFYDDEQIRTIYVTPNLLAAVDVPEDGAVIRVCQIADDHVLLSETNSIIWQPAAGE